MRLVTRIVLITGLPGTGKSMLARKLARRYGLPVVAKDTIKESLLDTLGATDSRQSRSLSDASFAVLFALMDELARAGLGMVLEGNFRVGAHESALRQILSKESDSPRRVRLAQVLCRTDEALRVARIRARQADPTRHAGHRDAEWVVGPLRATSDFLDVPAERFVLDTGPGDSMSAEPVLMEALDRWMHTE